MLCSHFVPYSYSCLWLVIRILLLCRRSPDGSGDCRLQTIFRGVLPHDVDGNWGAICGIILGNAGIMCIGGSGRKVVGSGMLTEDFGTAPWGHYCKSISFVLLRVTIKVFLKVF